MIDSQEEKKGETTEGVTPSVPHEKVSMSDAILKELDDIDAIAKSRKDSLESEGENKEIEKSVPASATGAQIEPEPEFRKLTVTISNDDYDLLLEEYIQLGIPNDEAFLLALINERGSTRTYQNAIKKNNPIPPPVEETENKDAEVKKEPIANKAPDETQSSKHKIGEDSYVPPPTIEDKSIDLSTVNWWKWGAIGIGALVVVYLLWNYFKNKTPKETAQLAQGSQQPINSASKASAPVVKNSSSSTTASATKGVLNTEGLNV